MPILKKSIFKSKKGKNHLDAVNVIDKNIKLINLIV